jgi:hypothetical protein
VVCLKKNYGKFCPCCAKNKELYDAGKKEDARLWNASRRSLFNVQPIVKGETQELHVLDVAYSCFAKLLVSEANECADGEDIINYADIEEGMIIKARMEEKPIGKNTFLDAQRIDFIDRDEEMEDELIDSAISFDRGIKILSEEEIEKIMYGADEGDDDEDDDEEEEKPRKKKKQADDDDDEDPPKKKKKREPEPGDEDDEEEEKEHPKKKKKKKSKPDCFGEVDKHDDCEDCEYWDDCADN